MAATQPKTDHITPRALNAAEAGKYLGVAVKTLSNWRALGKGPRYVRYTRGAKNTPVVYRREDLDAFIDAHVCV